jgi:hypothetical protein
MSLLTEYFVHENENEGGSAQLCVTRASGNRALWVRGVWNGGEGDCGKEFATDGM